MTYWASAQVQNARHRYSNKAKREEWDLVAESEVPSLTAEREANSHTEVLEVVYENQRWWPYYGWAKPANGTDPACWTTKHGWKTVPPNLYEVPSESQSWWRIDGEALDGGWAYALDFRYEFHQGCTATDMCRRRAWIREKIDPVCGPRVVSGQGPETTGAQGELLGELLDTNVVQQTDMGGAVGEMSNCSDEGFYSCEPTASQTGWEEAPGRTKGAPDRYLELELKRALIASQHGYSKDRKLVPQPGFLDTRPQSP